MLIHLHKQATTTPKVRAAIRASTEPASALAERFGTTEQTVYKWKHRDTVHDRSHTPHRLQTTLSPAERGRLGGIKGGAHRAALLSPEARVEAARKAAKTRWSR